MTVFSITGERLIMGNGGKKPGVRWPLAFCVAGNNTCKKHLLANLVYKNPSGLRLRFRL
jgi:hypothetical protein